MTEPLPLEPGISIGGHYTVGTIINKGGFGAVYHGADASEDNRPCAIKETYDVTPTARRQALMEAAILFTVRSKHLPQVYDAFEDNGRFYLVMQLIEGQTLQQLLKLRGRPCTEQEVLTWLLPIIDILQELHSRNPPVMHRDIKPANIILTPNQTAVLVDFGLTRLYDPSRDTHTMVRAVSAGFSPIEQYIGKTSPQSDIYALAATIYYLLTQVIPPASINRSVHDELIPPHLLNPLLSRKIERVLLKALAVSADQRYQSMQEFARALQAPEASTFVNPTISASRVQSAISPTEVAGPQMQPYLSFSNGRNESRPYPAYPVPATPVRRTPPTPAYPLPAVTPRPGNVFITQPVNIQNYRALPSPFSQGCLWGTIQGVVSAIMLLILKKEAYFYLGILEGFLFYLLAGYFTTRKGGKIFRGALAGLWAGISSTIVFWIVFAIGLLILLTQRIQIDTARAQQQHIVLNYNKELNHALQVVAPVFPSQPTTQPLAISLTIYLVGGLLCAIGFGWLGGKLGQRS